MSLINVNSKPATEICRLSGAREDLPCIHIYTSSSMRQPRVDLEQAGLERVFCRMRRRVERGYIVAGGCVDEHFPLLHIKAVHRINSLESRQRETGQ